MVRARQPWAIPWPCVYEFFSVVTHPRIWRDAASTPDEAWWQLEAWFDAPNLRLLAETEAFAPVLERVTKRSRVRGPVVHDARIAAICLAHGVATTRATVISRAADRQSVSLNDAAT